mgnify:CR=1 FL=1
MKNYLNYFKNSKKFEEGGKVDLNAVLDNAIDVIGNAQEISESTTRGASNIENGINDALSVINAAELSSITGAAKNTVSTVKSLFNKKDAANISAGGKTSGKGAGIAGQAIGMAANMLDGALLGDANFGT